MKHIILIGFMGSGKSTVGYRLSYKLKRCFLDTDKMIERKEGMRITEIFAAKGEGYFRERETACLEGLFRELGSRIISVGGGTPIKEENRVLLRRLGTVIYLKASANTLYERVKKDTSRPLLQCDDPKQRITELLSEREAVYESIADLVICVDGKEIQEVVQKIAEVVQ